MAFNREFFDYQCFKHGKTRGQVAAVLGVTYPTFLKKIIGESEWKISEMEKLADFLELNDLARDRMFGLGEQCNYSITKDLP